MKAKKALTLSIVIPVYNEQHQINGCLDAIQKQTVAPLQVLVVDNNCTDKTVALAKKYPFVKVLKQPQQGIVYARNKGFNAVQADIIGRIDADTRLAPDWISKTISYFVANPDFAAVSGPTHIRDWQGKFILYWGHRLLYYWSTWIFLGHRTLFGSNMALRSEAWKDVASTTCLQTSIHEDMDLSMHLKKLGYSIGFSDSMQATISPRRIMRMWHYPLMWVRTKTDHWFLFKRPNR